MQVAAISARFYWASRFVKPVIRSEARGISFCRASLAPMGGIRCSLATPSLLHSRADHISSGLGQPLRGEGGVWRTFTRRHFSLPTQQVGIIDYEELVKRMRTGDITVVDVRGVEEITQTGAIKAGDLAALNIPLDEIQNGALGANAQDFEDQFGFPKPPSGPHTFQEGHAVAFSCKSGIRASVAAQIAAQCGYGNAVVYKGSANEWFSKSAK